MDSCPSPGAVSVALIPAEGNDVAARDMENGWVASKPGESCWAAAWKPGWAPGVPAVHPAAGADVPDAGDACVGHRLDDWSSGPENPSAWFCGGGHMVVPSGGPPRPWSSGRPVEAATDGEKRVRGWEGLGLWELLLGRAGCPMSERKWFGGAAGLLVLGCRRSEPGGAESSRTAAVSSSIADRQYSGHDVSLDAM